MIPYGKLDGTSVLQKLHCQLLHCAYPAPKYICIHTGGGRLDSLSMSEECTITCVCHQSVLAIFSGVAFLPLKKAIPWTCRPESWICAIHLCSGCNDKVLNGSRVR
jgi:hypothetical protein